MSAPEESWVEEHLLAADVAVWAQLRALASRDTMGLRLALARVWRRIGQPDETVRLDGLPQARPHWTRGDIVRLGLLRIGCHGLSPDEQVPLVRRLLQTGELKEQESLLRILAALPEAHIHTDLAIEACRTNATRVFAAIATRNVFPAAYFPELAFNQMVLKALFMEVPAREIEQLPARATPELARMVRGYASERAAAGRPVPTDADWILSLPEVAP